MRLAINTNRFANYSASVGSCLANVSKASASLLTVKNGLNYEVLRRNGILTQINDVMVGLKSETRKLNAFMRALDEIKAHYHALEKRVEDVSKGALNGDSNIFGAYGDPVVSAIRSASQCALLFNVEEGQEVFSALGNALIVGVSAISLLKSTTSSSTVITESEVTYGKYKNKSILGDEDHWGINIEQTEVKDESKQVNPDASFYKDPKATILEGKIEKKAEVSVLEKELSGKNEWSQCDVDGKVLTAEAHCSGSAGFYVYSKDENGNVSKIFSPGVSAEVAASVAAFELEVDGRIGLGENNDMLGVYGDIDAKLLSAEGEAKISFNKDEAYLGAKVEADLAKVSGTGGVSVLGTDIGVTGSLKLGIGGHVEAGWTDGKFKFDMGAALGVGFDVGFEVDVSGTVDAICDCASSAWDGFSGMVSDFWDSVF